MPTIRLYPDDVNEFAKHGGRLYEILSGMGCNINAMDHDEGHYDFSVPGSIIGKVISIMSAYGNHEELVTI